MELVAILEYHRNGKGMNMISFSKEIIDNQVVLKSGKSLFKKKSKLLAKK